MQEPPQEQSARLVLAPVLAPYPPALRQRVALAVFAASMEPVLSRQQALPSVFAEQQRA